MEKFKPVRKYYSSRQTYFKSKDNQSLSQLKKPYKHVLTPTEIWLVDTETGEILSNTLRDDAQNQLHLHQILQEYLDQLNESTQKLLKYMVCRINGLNYSTVYPISTPDDLGISWITIEHSLEELKDNDLIRPTDYVNVYEMNPEIFQQIRTS